MHQILFSLLGLVIIGLTLLDVFWTTLAVGSGGGPITARVAKSLWNVSLSRHRQAASHQLLSFTGYIILLVSTLVWVFLTWAGWTLVFSANQGALVDSDSGQPVNLWERIYFTGYTLVTLGLGDYQPQGYFWQLATTAAAANGFFLLTLAITYLISVVSAVTQKRQLAVYISCLGKSPTEILNKAWNGKNFGLLEQHFISLTPILALYGQHHLTYPVMHYFHSVKRDRAAEVCVVVLDEALTMLEIGVKPEHRPDPVALYALRQAISEFLETLKLGLIHPSPYPPPVPTLEPLRASGIPTISDAAFEAEVENLNKRRRLLFSLVRNDGWSWEAILNSRIE